MDINSKINKYNKNLNFSSFDDSRNFALENMKNKKIKSERSYYNNNNNNINEDSSYSNLINKNNNTNQNISNLSNHRKYTDEQRIKELQQRLDSDLYEDLNMTNTNNIQNNKNDNNNNNLINNDGMNLNIVQLKVVEVESTNSNYMDSEKTIDKNRRKFSSLEKGIYNFIIIFYLFRKKYYKF